jgi:hypothetical protein
VQLRGLRQLKNPVTSSEIEPATFRLVSQGPNKLRYRVPLPVLIAVTDFKQSDVNVDFHFLLSDLVFYNF